MDAQTVQIIADVVIETVKILGPAIIAGIIGIKAGRSQVEAKLKELEKTYSYTASERLFEYYQKRETELKKAYENIYESLGLLLGLTPTDEPEDESIKEIIKLYKFYERSLPKYVKLTQRDMKKFKLDDTEEFSILNSTLDSGSRQEDSAGWGDKVTRLLEKYENVEICNQMVLEELSTNYMKIFIKT